jgi:hypothetical protein
MPGINLTTLWRCAGSDCDCCVPQGGRAGRALISQPSLAFADGAGNIVTGAENLPIYVKLENYSGTSATAPLLYVGCVTLTSCQERPVVSALSRRGIGTYTDLALTQIGWYTFRFYAEALFTFSASFYVGSAPPTKMDSIVSPGSSSCRNSGRDLSAANTVCRRGGNIFPQPSLKVYDQFGNQATEGERVFKISIQNNPGGSILVCQDRFFDPQGFPDDVSCITTSANGFIRFTDLGLDVRGRGYVLRVENIDGDPLPPIYSQPFDVFGVDGVIVQSGASLVSVGCPLDPPVLLQSRGYPADSLQLQRVAVSGATVSVSIFRCIAYSTDMSFTEGSLAGKYALKSGVYNLRASYASSSMQLFFCLNGTFCPSSYWAFSPVLGQCESPVAYACDAKAKTPGEISTLWFNADGSILAGTIVRDTKQCLQGVENSLWGVTEVPLTDGIANFTQIRLNSTGLYTLRFIMRFNGSTDQHIVDHVVEARDLSVGGINVTRQPVGGAANRPLAVAPRITIADLFRDSVTGWICEALTCVAARAPDIRVSAEVLGPEGQPAQFNDGKLIEISQGVLELEFVPLTAGNGSRAKFTLINVASSCAASGNATSVAYTALTQGFNVTFGPPATVRFNSNPPATIRAGDSFLIGVSLIDIFGNVIPLTGTLISISISNGPADAQVYRRCGPPDDAPGECAPMMPVAVAGSASSAAASFSVAFSRSGTYRLRAQTVSFAGVASALSAEVQVVHAEVAEHTRLVVTRHPSSVTAGSALSPAPEWTLMDAFGNIILRDVTISRMTVTLASEATARASDLVLFGPADVVFTNGVGTVGADLTVTNMGEAPAGVCIATRYIFCFGNVSFSQATTAYVRAMTSAFTVSPAAASSIDIAVPAAARTAQVFPVCYLPFVQTPICMCIFLFLRVFAHRYFFYLCAPIREMPCKFVHIHAHYASMLLHTFIRNTPMFSIRHTYIHTHVGTTCASSAGRARQSRLLHRAVHSCRLLCNCRHFLVPALVFYREFRGRIQGSCRVGCWANRGIPYIRHRDYIWCFLDELVAAYHHH